LLRRDHPPVGRFNLVAVGEERFKVLSISHEQPFLTGVVECLPIDMTQTADIHRGAQSLENEIHRYLTLLAKTSPEPVNLTRVELPSDPLPRLYLACAILQIPPEEKQPLLAAPSAGELLRALHRLYAREISLLPQFSKTKQARQRTAWLN
jgi:Lon protease-like protein